MVTVMFSKTIKLHVNNIKNTCIIGNTKNNLNPCDYLESLFAPAHRCMRCRTGICNAKLEKISCIFISQLLVHKGG